MFPHTKSWVGNTTLHPWHTPPSPEQCTILHPQTHPIFVKHSHFSNLSWPFGLYPIFMISCVSPYKKFYAQYNFAPMAHPTISRTVYHIESINLPYICEGFPLFKSWLAIRFIPPIYDFVCFPIQKVGWAVQLCTHGTPHHLQNCVPY